MMYAFDENATCPKTGSGSGSVCTVQILKFAIEDATEYEPLLLLKRFHACDQ
jgi:hypothetical protein